MPLKGNGEVRQEKVKVSFEAAKARIEARTEAAKTGSEASKN